jgi:hypothetical protein
MNGYKRIVFLFLIFCIVHGIKAQEVISGEAKMVISEGTFVKGSKDLVLKDYAELHLKGMLTVTGAIENYNGLEGLYLYPSVDGAASLQFDYGNPLARVGQMIKVTRNQYIASPVAEESVGTFINSGQNTMRMFEFTDGSGYQLMNENMHLRIGRGYYLQMFQTMPPYLEVTLKGVLNAEDLELNSTSNPPLLHNTAGYNLVANPFASVIDWTDEGIETYNMEQSIWVYDTDYRRFRFVNRSGYGNLNSTLIPVGGAFLTRTFSSNAELIIPKSARRHAPLEDNPAKLKDDFMSNLIVFQVDGSQSSDEIWLGYEEFSTHGFDNGTDISKMYAFEDELMIYSSHDNMDFCVDMISKPDENTEFIPLFFKKGAGEEYALELKSFEGFYDEVVTLEDLKTGDIINVEGMEPYSFTHTKDDPDHRFNVHFTPEEQIGWREIAKSKHMLAYANSGILYVRSYNDLINETKTVKVFSADGRLLKQYSALAENLSRIPLHIPTQVVVVVCEYENTVERQKLMVY